MLRAAARRKGLQSVTAISLLPCTCRPSTPPVASPFASTCHLQLLHSAPPRYARPWKIPQPIDSSTYSPTEALDAGNPADPSASAVAVEPTRMQMRPYQVDVINAVLGTLKEGEYTRLGVSAPTGSGKTAIFTSLIHRLPTLIHPHTKQEATKVLIVVGAIQLAKQAVETVRRAYPELEVELEQGHNRASGKADVTVATYQTLAFSDLERLDKFDPRDYKAVIIDEAHHAAAPSYLAILSRFDPRITEPLRDAFDPTMDPLAPSPIAPSPEALAELAEESEEADDFAEPEDLAEPEAEDSRSASYDNSQHAAFLAPSEPAQDFASDPPMPARLTEDGDVCVPLLAFTATWHRADGLALGKVFEKIVWHGDWLDMIRGRWLSQLQFTTIKLGDALDINSVDVSRSSNEYVMASLAKALDKTEVNRRAVEAWMEKASERRSTLVFCVSIAHIVSLTNAFREQGIDARFVHEGIKVYERERLYDQFKRGEFPVLINCGILTEGADFPCIDCVLLARPTRSKNLFLQMIGRGLRLSPNTNKESCLIIDLVGNSTAGVVCTPTLFGIDPDTTLEGKTQEELEMIAQEEQEALAAIAEATAAEEAKEKPDSRRLIYTDYKSIFDMVPGREGEDELPTTHINNLSTLAWVGTGAGGFVLELGGNGHVKVMFNKDDSQWDAHFYRRFNVGNGPRFSRAQLLYSDASLAHLLPRIDQHILSTPDINPIIDLRRTAGWRFSPASEAQCALILAKLAKPLAEERFEQRSWIPAVWVPGRKGERVEVTSLKKGEASDLLARVKHGAMGAVKQWETGRKREEKKREKESVKEQKEREKRKREKVKASRGATQSRFVSHQKMLSRARKLAEKSEERRSDGGESSAEA